MYFKTADQGGTGAGQRQALWDKRETERRRTADKEAREAISREESRIAGAQWDPSVSTDVDVDGVVRWR